MSSNQIVVDHCLHGLLAQLFNLLHFVGGPETIEVVQHRNAGLKGRSLGDQGEVHDFLHVVRAEHGPTGLPAGHNIGVVTEDR